MRKIRIFSPVVAGMAIMVAYAGQTPLWATSQLNINLSNPAINQALPVQWQQNTISLSQLQSLMASNPGYGLYNIHFPNGASWNVAPSQLTSVAQEAKKLGYGTMPDISFSSLGNSMNSALSTIPIGAVSNSMNQSMNQALQQLRYQQMNLSDSLPDWLKSSIVWMSGMFSQLWDWLVQQYHAHF